MNLDNFIDFILIPLVKIGILFGVLSLVIAYLTLLERKVIAFMQVRLGPMRVGPHGLLQPIADGLKLMLKEDIVPSQADRVVFMLAGSLSLVDIVNAQKNSGFWYVVLQPVGFLLFFTCGVAETNRAPFDLPEAESELVAGFHTEYSGFRFSLFFLAEYAAMIVVASMAVTLFWGGWLRPFPNVGALSFLDFVPPVLWFAAKVIVFLYFYLWFRASWPRYRYDQLMKLGWQFLLPLSMANVIVTAIVVVLLGKKG